MEPLEGIFLDFYGTVVGEDRRAVESVCQAVIDDHGLDMTARDLALDWGKVYFAAIDAVNGSGFRLLADIERDTLVETVQPLLGPIDPGPYIDQLNRYLVSPPLFDDVREVLAACPLPVCIVSNADERELRAAVEHNQLTFDVIVTSELAKSYKPGPRILHHALELTGWASDRVIHVGDSLHSDVGGAHRAGLRAAWVNRADRISDIGTEKPDWVWHDLKPIISLVVK